MFNLCYEFHITQLFGCKQKKIAFNNYEADEGILVTSLFFFFKYEFLPVNWNNGNYLEHT